MKEGGRKRGIKAAEGNITQRGGERQHRSLTVNRRKEEKSVSDSEEV